MLKNTLGTVEIAKIIGMSRITVHGWIKRGELRADRTPGRHFRVKPSDLLEFLEQRGSPIPDELREACQRKVVTVGADLMWISRLTRLLNPPEAEVPVHVEPHENPLAALMSIGAEPPRVVLVKTPLDGVSAVDLIRAIKNRRQKTRVLAIAPSEPMGVTDGAERYGAEGESSGASSEEGALLDAGADEVLREPVDQETACEHARAFFGRGNE